MHYGPEKKKTQQKKSSNHSLFHKQGSEWVTEQANKWAVQANEQMDKWMAQYLHINS